MQNRAPNQKYLFKIVITLSKIEKKNYEFYFLANIILKKSAIKKKLEKWQETKKLYPVWWVYSLNSWLEQLESTRQTCESGNGMG